MAEDFRSVLIVLHVLLKYYWRHNGLCVFDVREYVAAIKRCIKRDGPAEVVVTKKYDDDVVYPRVAALRRLNRRVKHACSD